MTIREIYDLALRFGIKNDPRGVKSVNHQLKKESEIFKNLNEKTRSRFDKEKLKNPYSDTRILFESSKMASVKTVLAGIDISVSELLLADRLCEKNKKIDLVISHHPIGRALAHLDEVVKLQAELMAQFGVPINVAESLLDKRVEELARKLSPGNHNRPVDAAKLLDISLMSIHSPCDNLVYQFLLGEIDKKKPETVGELYELILSIPEYHEAANLGIGPKIFAGKPGRQLGKIALTEMTGGTSGHKNIYEKLSQAGIGTIVGMHIDEEFREEAEKHHLNIVIAGHMPSDSLGMNLFLDQLENKGIKIISCSGLIRIKRNQKL